MFTSFISEQNTKISIIGNISIQGNSSMTLTEANKFEKIVEINNLPAGTYIVSGRVQYNMGTPSTTITSWVSITYGSEQPLTSYGNSITFSGGTAYPIANIVRIVDISADESIYMNVRSSDTSHVFAGVLQAVRIA